MYFKTPVFKSYFSLSNSSGSCRFSSLHWPRRRPPPNRPARLHSPADDSPGPGVCLSAAAPGGSAPWLDSQVQMLLHHLQLCSGSDWHCAAVAVCLVGCMDGWESRKQQMWEGMENLDGLNVQDRIWTSPSASLLFPNMSRRPLPPPVNVRDFRLGSLRLSERSVPDGRSLARGGRLCL